MRNLRLRFEALKIVSALPRDRKEAMIVMDLVCDLMDWVYLPVRFDGDDGDGAPARSASLTDADNFEGNDPLSPR